MTRRFAIGASASSSSADSIGVSFVAIDDLRGFGGFLVILLLFLFFGLPSDTLVVAPGDAFEVSV